MAIAPLTLGGDISNVTIAVAGNCQEYSAGAGIQSVIVQSLGAPGKFITAGAGLDGAAIGAAKFLTLPANTPLRLPIRKGANFALAGTAATQAFEVVPSVVLA